MCLHVYMCIMYVPGLQRVQKKASNRTPLNGSYRWIVSHPVGARNLHQVLCQSNKSSPAPSSALQQLIVQPCLFQCSSMLVG